MKKIKNNRKIENELFSIYSDLYSPEEAEDHMRKALRVYKIIRQDVIFKHR
jgi:hypothetical protein